MREKEWYFSLSHNAYISFEEYAIRSIDISFNYLNRVGLFLKDIESVEPDSPNEKSIELIYEAPKQTIRERKNKSDYIDI